MNRKNLKKRKKRNPIHIILIIIAATIIPFIYRIFISSYIKNNLAFSLKIKYIEIYKEKLKQIYSILFNKYNIQIILPLLIVFNYCNTYKTFTLLISLQFPLIISQVINIYLIDTIKDKEDIDNELLYATGYPLFLWKLFSKSEFNRERSQSSSRSIDTVQNNQKPKNIILLVVIIVFEYLIHFILFNDLDKIIYDLLLGLIMYFVFFYVLNIKTNNPKQFIKIIEFKFKYYFLLFLFFNLFFAVFCSDITNNNEDKIYIIEKIIYKYSISSMLIGTIIGTKCEYYYYFEKKLNIWSQFNFESDFELSDEEEEESLTSIISSNYKKQWNNTSRCISLLRLIFCICITFGCLISLIFSHFENFFIELLLKYILSVNLFSFGLFFWYKIILKYLKVTNIFLLTSLRESF
jgi:hypothetical protein